MAAGCTVRIAVSQTQRVPPVTRYAKSGDVRIAYQVVGEGPFDLVYVPGAMSHVDLTWENPARARYSRPLRSGVG